MTVCTFGAYVYVTVCDFDETSPDELAGVLTKWYPLKLSALVEYVSPTYGVESESPVGAVYSAVPVPNTFPL